MMDIKELQARFWAFKQQQDREDAARFAARDRALISDWFARFEAARARVAMENATHNSGEV